MNSDFLKQEKINENLIKKVEEFKEKYEKNPEYENRIGKSHFKYYGKDVWDQALSALIAGKNLLLVGEKSTGKNVLAENLSELFLRPLWNVSFHVNTDANSLIGSDTFKNNQVLFRPGPVYLSAVNGGFCVLDEINMAKNEALSVLHSVLDYRRIIDVPGYDRIKLSPATRFIGTMNYGYQGTRDLNEALLSRFAVIKMPTISKENLFKLLSNEFTDLKEKYTSQFVDLFMELKNKCDAGEISFAVLDLRGLIDAIDLMKLGLSPLKALNMFITNKSFDQYEKNLIFDALSLRIPKNLNSEELFK